MCVQGSGGDGGAAEKKKRKTERTLVPDNR